MDKSKYHFQDLRAELFSVEDMEETKPEQFCVHGIIKMPGHRSGPRLLPVVAYNGMALAMSQKMRVGQDYLFNGYFVGDTDEDDPLMLLQVCWTDRLN